MSARPPGFGISTGHLRNRDPPQQLDNGLVHLAQRLANRAFFRLVAAPMLGKTRCQNNRAVDRVDHLERADLLRAPRQLVTAARPR